MNASLALDQIDVSDPTLYERDAWRPLFARLRSEDPVHYCADSPFGPYWSITRFDDILEVDRDHDTWSAEPTVTIGDPEVRAARAPIQNFISQDPPIHDERRKVVAPSMSPRNLREMEVLIRERTALILDGLPRNETFDWVERVGVELTSRMLATLFDFPQEQRRKLIYWSDIFVSDPRIGGQQFQREERRAAVRDAMETFSAMFRERRAHPTEGAFDLITMLAQNESTQDMVERPEELLGNIILLVVGGNDTTRNSMAGGVLALNQFPAEFEKLRSNRSLIGSMVPEIIRWQSPVLHIRRTVKQDTELGGKTIRAGEKAIMWYISGNRDETAITDADDFIIDRPNPRHHLSFGFGIHRCMGNRLAEMQLRILWEELLDRFDRIEVVGDVGRLRSNQIRGITSLPVQMS